MFGKFIFIKFKQKNIYGLKNEILISLFFKINFY